MSRSDSGGYAAFDVIPCSPKTEKPPATSKSAAADGKITRRASQTGIQKKPGRTLEAAARLCFLIGRQR
jgi:hypothetical protein